MKTFEIKIELITTDDADFDEVAINDLKQKTDDFFESIGYYPKSFEHYPNCQTVKLKAFDCNLEVDEI